MNVKKKMFSHNIIIFNRMATERELEKSDALTNVNIEFDYSGHFILYPTMIGIKVVNIETNRCMKILGKGDNLRPLHVSIFQGRSKKAKAVLSLEQEGSENPILLQTHTDPTVVCTSFKYICISNFSTRKRYQSILSHNRKPRFYLYSRRMPSDLQDVDRDVFNEKPSKEDIIAIPEGQGKCLFSSIFKFDPNECKYS